MGKYITTVSDRLVLPAQVFLTLGQERDLHRKRQPVPAGVPIRLAIDTGPGRTSLVPSTLDRLKPLARERVRMMTGQGSTLTRLYWIRLEFPNTDLLPIPVLAVARSNLPPNMPGFHGVLGRDVLSRWESFHWHGRRGRLTIRDVPGWFTRLWR
jgi:hypothetical protein